MFFYGHPQNRFWKVIAGAFGAAVPQTIPEKKAFLLSHHLALWDVIHSCDIKGSSDASITNVVANDLTPILSGARIRKILVNGKTAEKYYVKWQEPVTKRQAICMPSTSPANAAWSLERLVEVWRSVLIEGQGNWKIKHIFDGDFGCEERPSAQGGPVVSVTLVNDIGEEKYVTVEDAWLVKNGLDVGSVWPYFERKEMP